MINDALYKQWLSFLFERPDADDPLRWDEAEFVATNEEKILLVEKTFRQCGVDLASYTDAQVNNGLQYIFDPGFSDISPLLCQKGVAEDVRTECVRAIKNLYSDCFFRRCTKTLSHLDEPGGGVLNSICYMLWDISPLTQWKAIVIDIMEEALYLPHDACIESALHGLGHRYYQDQTRVSEVIVRFLSKTQGLRPELRRYAEQAKRGAVQ